MPTYTFRNEENDDEFEIEMKMSELDQFKLDNPHYKQIITSSKIIRGRESKPDATFRDLLGHIHKNNRGSKINTY